MVLVISPRSGGDHGKNRACDRHHHGSDHVTPVLARELQHPPKGRTHITDDLTIDRSAPRRDQAQGRGHDADCQVRSH